MLLYTVQGGAVQNDPLFSGIGAASGSLALPLFTIIVIQLPENVGTVQQGLSFSHLFSLLEPDRTPRSWLLLWYMRGFFLFSLLVAGLSLIFHLHLLQTLHEAEYRITIYIYYTCALLSLILAFWISYHRSSTARAKQQFWIFVSGILVMLVPLCLFTLLPSLLQFPARYIFDSLISTMSVVLFPFILGYAILRYQFLVFDTYIKRVANAIIGGIGMVLLVYLAVTLTGLILEQDRLYTIYVAIEIAILGPTIWRAALYLTEHLFFRESIAYRQLIEKPALLAHQDVDLIEASRLITTAVNETLETSDVCLFVLDEESGSYQLRPMIDDKGLDRYNRYRICQQLQTHFGDEKTSGIPLHTGLLSHLASIERPLFLHEIPSHDLRMPGKSGREQELLLSPILVQGKIIAVLALGQRKNQMYAASELDAMQLLLARYASMLETARLQSLSKRQTQLLNTFYGATTLQFSQAESLEEVASSLTRIAAQAIHGRAEIWWYHQESGELEQKALEGMGPEPPTFTPAVYTKQTHLHSCFYEMGDDPERLKQYVQHLPELPLAWIPLKKGTKQYGLLVLTYQHAHSFLPEERRILEIFAGQCLSILENTQITLELRNAYERQKDLDRLKDHFIITTSHELRTPLTAVQGYLELLGEYDEIDKEMRGLFIEKARRSCDELLLMMENILDANQVDYQIEKIQLERVPLQAAISKIVETVEAIAHRGKHQLHVSIPEDLLVLADPLRLHQVVLNLINNALKYAAVGTAIEIHSNCTDGMIALHIRDHGPGIPPADQAHLFERFTRLERDLNSPVRGAGLGLYICKQLVEAMGGQIWVESRGIPGEGSTFSLTLQHYQEAFISQPLILAPQAPQN